MLNFGIAFTTKREVSLLLLLGLIAGLIACQSHQTAPQNERFQLHGVVVSIENSEHSITVKHDEIPGYMSAMTMPYEGANQQDLEKLLPGSEIRADVVVDGGSVRLENIRVVRKSSQPVGAL
jgi:protein SCO1